MTVSDTLLDEAAARLRAGELVAFPTETVYGLGADATSPRAVAGIFAAKGRPTFNPLIAHVANLHQASREGVFTLEALRLAERFWPGPLTLVLPRAEQGTVCDLACAGLDSVGLRVPSQPTALALLRKVERPVAAPSANRSGRLSPTEAHHVQEDLGDGVAMVLDEGSCSVGLESTIVRCQGGEVSLLRPGAITPAEIEAVIGKRLQTAGSAIRAPGMLASHYAPRARLRLDAATLRAGEVGLDFGTRLPGAARDLSPGGDLAEAAANLYRLLRELDHGGAETIAVATIPDAALGMAINDRLRRAAAPRS